MQIETKPFAPYGAILNQLLCENITLNNTLMLYCGKLGESEAKKSLQNGILALCLPYGRAVADFRWNITGLRLIVYDTGGMASLGLKRMSYDLLKLGADAVIVLSGNELPDVHILKKEGRKHGRRQNIGRIG